jgi:ribosomal protein S18 acetylase RimI-like enzyme
MTEEFDREDAPIITVFVELENSGAVHVAKSLAAEMTASFGPRDEQPLSIAAHVGDMVAGGLNGAIHWGWCYIRHLWVQEDWRRRGLGRRLLAEAETQASARHCAGLYVDTFNPDAALFYEQAGFTLFGRIEQFPPGHARMFLSKDIGA